MRLTKSLLMFAIGMMSFTVLGTTTHQEQCRSCHNAERIRSNGFHRESGTIEKPGHKSCEYSCR